MKNVITRQWSSNFSFSSSTFQIVPTCATLLLVIYTPNQLYLSTFLPLHVVSLGIVYSENTIWDTCCNFYTLIILKNTHDSSQIGATIFFAICVYVKQKRINISWTTCVVPTKSHEFWKSSTSTLMFTPNTRSINSCSSTNLSIVFIICFFIMLGILVKCYIFSKHFMNPHYNASLASKQ